MKCHVTPIRLEKSKSLTTPTTGKDMHKEKLSVFYTHRGKREKFIF